MSFRVGNAPCSWGVEFAGDPRNPPWQQVLAECAEAGYKGIELGPIGYLPEDPIELADALGKHDLELIGGVVFQPFHDTNRYEDLIEQAHRTATSLTAHGAQQLVLIDSIASHRAPYAGRPSEAIQLSSDEWKTYVSRIRDIARMGTDEFGLTVSIHSHAGGFMDFKDELERLLNEIDSSILKLCVDTGHQTYAGFDPIAFIDHYYDRLAYVHCKDIDPLIKSSVITNRTGFYDACGQGIFCKLGQGEVRFDSLYKLLTERGFTGWVTVEQDCDPTLDVSPLLDARANRDFLAQVGF